MAANPIPKSIPSLQAAAGKARAGLVQYKDAIGLLHNNSDVVAQKLAEVIMACGTYDAGKLELTNLKQALRSHIAEARALAKLTRDTLKPYLGEDHSEAWIGVGFRKSLRVPRSAAAVQSLMLSMKGWLAAHPDRQIEALSITAARTGTLHDNIVTATTNIALQSTIAVTLTNARKQKIQELRRRLRMLFNELEMKLDPMDERWLAFGFNRPGARKTPPAPAQPQVVVTGTTATLTLAKTPRAEYHRVWMKVEGRDDEAVAVGSPADLLFVINDLPPNTPVEFSVSAVNNGGESVRSKIVRVLVE